MLSSILLLISGLAGGFTVHSAYAGPTGTLITAQKTAVANWTSTQDYNWAISKSVPPSQAPYIIPTGQSQNVTFTVTATRTPAGGPTHQTPITGQVCVTNQGLTPTSGLQIIDQIERVSDSAIVEGPISLPVLMELSAGQTQCYNYSFSGILDPSQSYRNHAIISINNYVGHEGTSYSISTFADVIPIITPFDRNANAAITDTFTCPNGFTCAPSWITQTPTDTTSYPFSILITNVSAPCGQNFTFVNTATLVPSTTQVPQTSTAQVTITSGNCGGFQNGNYCTYTQGGWGSNPAGMNPGAILAANFGTVYPTGVTVGGNGGSFTASLSTSAAINTYLPAGGSPAVFIQNYTNPASTSAGVFGGQVLALEINVDFNNANIISGTSGSISSLVLQGTGTSLDGQTVAQILASANQSLGGGVLPSGFTVSTLNSLIDNLNTSFDNCAPTAWAQIHLNSMH